MQELIPPSKPVPEPRQPQWFYADEGPEIEFRAVEPKRGKWRFLAASVAILLATLSVGWATADHIGAVLQPEPAKPDPVATAAAQAVDAAKAQAQQLAALRVHVDGLKSKLDAQARRSRSEEATIATLQKNLSDAKADAAATASKLQAKLERVQTEAEKLAQRKVDRSPTGSIGKPLPRPARVHAVPPLGEHAPLGPYRAFVLRDAGGGRALVEGAGRMEEVEPGDILPGGALVERIERRGQAWVVRTDRGYIGPEFMWDD